MKINISILFLTIVLFVSCDNKRTSEKPFNITAEDTLQCLHVASACMDSLKSGNINAALNMMYILKNDTLYPLHINQKKELSDKYSLFPVLDYEISELIFDEYKGHTVRFRVQFEENAYTSMQFNLANTGESWHLVIN